MSQRVVPSYTGGFFALVFNVLFTVIRFSRFRTGKGLGYSAHFSGFTLILESANKTSKKPQYHQVEKQLLPYQVGGIERKNVKLLVTLT